MSNPAARLGDTMMQSSASRGLAMGKSRSQLLWTLVAMAIGIQSYFQKIADPRDIASNAGVSFTINHVAAVVIPEGDV